VPWEGRDLFRVRSTPSARLDWSVSGPYNSAHAPRANSERLRVGLQALSGLDVRPGGPCVDGEAVPSGAEVPLAIPHTRNRVFAFKTFAPARDRTGSFMSI
jgi:hypothetical protein